MNLAVLLPLAGLVLMYTLFALEPAVLTLLYSYGDSHPVMGHSPVTYCNILVIANITYGLCVAVLYRRDFTLQAFRNVTRRQWVFLATSVLVTNVFSQALYFASVIYTSVANVVLISSLQIPLGALIAAVLFGEALVRRQYMGQALIMAGIALPFLLMRHPDADGWFNIGDLIAVAAMLTRLASTFLSKELTEVPLGILGVVSAVTGTVIFSTIAMVLYGWGHFNDLVTPDLWVIVAIYAVGLVVSRRVLKYYSFRGSSRQSIISMSAIYPLVTITAAAFIAGQVPTTGQVVGLVGITIGMLLAADWRKRKAETPLERNQTGEQVTIKCNP